MLLSVFCQKVAAKRLCDIFLTCADFSFALCSLYREHSVGGSDKWISPSAVKFSPRGRVQPLSRTPTGGRRTPSRELVSFGRHKLRRLSPTVSRTSKEHTLRAQYRMIAAYLLFLSGVALMNSQLNAHP